MAVWAIADLHLSLAQADRRERFAARWLDHAGKIEKNWREVVRPDDLVLLPGDISMARNHRDLRPDLAWIDRLPGTKVLSRGNHDAWFNETAKLRPMLRRSLHVVGGDAELVCGAVVCGTLGSPVLIDDTDPARLAIAARQLEALDRSLAGAKAIRQPGTPLYVLWHYPPFDAHRRPGDCVGLFESAEVTACVYGHLHNEGQWSNAVQGVVGSIRYHCVAADAIGFRPLLIDR